MSEPSEEALQLALNLPNPDYMLKDCARDIDAFAARAVAEERERCARMLEAEAERIDPSGDGLYDLIHAKQWAAAIRARGNPERKKT